MTYPILPMALVTFLAGISEQRAALPKGPTHVTVIAHHGTEVRSRRYAVQNDANWSEMEAGAAAMFAEGPVDTMTVIYPSAGDDPVDSGVIIERGKPLFTFSWTYSPKFDIRLAHEDTTAQITKGVGIEMLQRLINRPVLVAAD